MTKAVNELSNEFLRQLLTDAFSHDELLTLCFDRFPDLYEDVKGWTHQQSIRELIVYCRRRDQVNALLQVVKERNPVQYKRYEPYLTRNFSHAGPGLVQITVEISNDPEQVQNFLQNLTAVLGVPAIRAVRIEKGSVKLTVILPAEGIGRLLALHEADEQRLIDLGIRDINLVQPDLSGANLSGANLSGANLSGANLILTSLNLADLTGADLRGAYLNGADLSKAYLNEANLGGAYLTGANLSGANLGGANLSGAKISRAYLLGAYLNGADLSGVDLSGANLSGAKISRAIMFEASLSGADLSGADLRGANLKNVDLSNTRLESANLSQVALDANQLFHAVKGGAIIDDLTQFSEHMSMS